MAHNLPIAFFLLFLALCAGCCCQEQPADLGSEPWLLSNCSPCDCQKDMQLTEIKAWPTISSSNPFQDANTMDLVLQCNQAPGSDAYSLELIFSQEGSVLYNSTLKRENGVIRINATSIQFPSQNLPLINLTCAYNNSFSSNSLDIPYLNIDEFQISPNQLGFGQTSTVSCKVAMKRKPDNFTVRFLFQQTSHFEFKYSSGEIFWFNLASSNFRNKIQLKKAGHLVISKYPVYLAIFAIEITPIWYEHVYYQSDKYKQDISSLLSQIQCELQYEDNEQLSVRSNQYSISL